jgi:hypothetical protein
VDINRKTGCAEHYTKGEVKKRRKQLKAFAEMTRLGTPVAGRQTRIGVRWGKQLSSRLSSGPCSISLNLTATQ